MRIQYLLGFFVLAASSLSYGSQAIALQTSEEKKKYALDVIPRLNSMLPSELESFLHAYTKYFEDESELLHAQDADGNTLLHNIVLFTKNVQLFDQYLAQAPTFKYGVSQ